MLGSAGGHGGGPYGYVGVYRRSHFYRARTKSGNRTATPGVGTN